MTAKNSSTNGTTPATSAPLVPEQILPEAPASASAKMTSPQGIEWLLTVRDFTVNGLLQKCKVLEDHLLKDGWTPASTSYGRSAAPNGHADHGTAPLCPTHGTPMKQSKHGGWYCPQKVAPTGGGSDGSKPIYCKAKVS